MSPRDSSDNIHSELANNYRRWMGMEQEDFEGPIPTDSEIVHGGLLQSIPVMNITEIEFRLFSLVVTEAQTLSLSLPSRLIRNVLNNRTQHYELDNLVDVVVSSAENESRFSSQMHLLEMRMLEVLQQVQQIVNPPEFRQSGFDEDTSSDIRNPFASEFERELSRLTRYARGFEDQGHSDLRDPFFDIDAGEFDQNLDQFVNRFLGAGSVDDRAHMVELVRAYIDGYLATIVDDNRIADNVQRQHGGYDAMARIIAEHSGNHAAIPWDLTGSPALMQMLHDMGYWQDLDRRVVASAEGEYQAWTDTNDPQRRQRSESNAVEHDVNVASLENYWRAAGLGANAAANRAENSFNDAANAPWSAAFISFIMMQAGAGNTFNYSSAHSNYAVTARQNVRNNTSTVTQPSRMMDATVEPVHVGGLIHRNRAGGTPNRTYDNLAAGNRTHADLVVAIEIYNNIGNRIPAHYQFIIDNTDPAILATYNIFAVTIGGNTIDQEIVSNGGNMDINSRTPTGSVQGAGNETTGRRFWRLNTDLTINNAPIPNLTVYGIQRLEHPPRSI